MITRRRGTYLPLKGYGATRPAYPREIVTEFTAMWESMIADYLADGDDDDEVLGADAPMVDALVEFDIREAMDAAVARRLARRRAA